MKLAYHYFIIFSIFIIYSLYIQFSTSMGNIWIRNDSNGNPIFCPNNLFKLILYSLTDINFWVSELIIINFWIYIIIYLIIFNLFNYTSLTVKTST